MKDFELDAQLRETLHNSVDHMKADDTMKARIDFMVNNQNKTGSKKLVWKRIAVGLAVALCLTTVGAFARGQIAGLVSSLKTSDMRFSVEELQKDTGKVADGIVIPEKLGAYAFQKGSIEYTDKMDENGNRFGTYAEIAADYGDVLNYGVRAYDSELDGDGLLPKNYDGQPYEVRDINGVEVAYRADEYLFVPVGYELTAEEQERMDANELNVSEGADEREEVHYQFMTWQVGDVVYKIYTRDASVTAEDLFAAAAEIIG